MSLESIVGQLDYPNRYRVTRVCLPSAEIMHGTSRERTIYVVKGSGRWMFAEVEFALGVNQSSTAPSGEYELRVGAESELEYVQVFPLPEAFWTQP